MSRTNFQELLDAGVHFGHLARKWNPKMAPYIFDQKNGIHIIDLHKTVVKIDEAAEEMKQLEQFLIESGIDKRVAIVRAITEIPPYHEHIELLPKNLNKGTALNVCRTLPFFQGRKLIGIGDYKNDIELLESADIACCPENACSEIHKLADYVMPSNNDDAIAALIYDCIPNL